MNNLFCLMMLEILTIILILQYHKKCLNFLIIIFNQLLNKNNNFELILFLKINTEFLILSTILVLQIMSSMVDLNMLKRKKNNKKILMFIIENKALEYHFARKKLFNQIINRWT